MKFRKFTQTICQIETYHLKLTERPETELICYRRHGIFAKDLYFQSFFSSKNADANSTKFALVEVSSVISVLATIPAVINDALLHRFRTGPCWGPIEDNAQ